MASMCKKDIFATFLCCLELFTSTPDRACGCAAKLSASLRARTSARERVRGSHKKRTAKAVPYLYAEFMELLLPPDRACACGAKLSAFAPSTNVISPQLLRATKNRGTAYAGPRFLAAACQPNPNFSLLPTSRCVPLVSR